MEEKKATNTQQESNLKENVKPGEKKLEKTKEAGKSLNPAQKQRLKKMLVIPLMCLACAGCIYLIFAPSADNKENRAGGFNATIPEPNEKGINGNKEKAYEQEAMAEKQRERMRTLDEFMFDADSTAGSGQVLNSSFSAPEKKQAGPLENSQAAYQNISRQMSGFYQDGPEDDQEKLALEYRIQELEQRISQKDESKARQEEQLAMMEKSYQMAAKYINPQPQVSAPTQVPAGKENPLQRVSAVPQRSVSGLEQEISDSVLLAEYTCARNMGFNTAVGAGYGMAKNTIRACVSETTTLTDGQPVRLRLLEAMQAGKIIIPVNSLVTGQARVAGERLDIIVSSVEYKGNIIPVELTVYDTDGQQGICVPGSMEMNAAKEIAANMGSGLGSSLTITQNAGSQLAADLGKGLIQGTSQYLGKKFRTVKVTLKANYQVMFYAKE